MGNLGSNLAHCLDIRDNGDDGHELVAGAGRVSARPSSAEGGKTYMTIGSGRQSLSKPLTSDCNSELRLPQELSGSLIMRKPSLDFSDDTVPSMPQDMHFSTLDQIPEHLEAEDAVVYSDALYKLGQAYEKGNDGLDKNPKMAFDTFLRAAELGHAKAQLRAGFYYEAGIGVPKVDFAAASKWYQRAAMQGDAKAMFSLGLSLAKGHTELGQQPVEAVKWFERAAVKGYDRAMYNYGYCLEMGLGVDKNLAVAVQWYSRARDLGNSHAKYRLTILNSNAL